MQELYFRQRLTFQSTGVTLKIKSTVVTLKIMPRFSKAYQLFISPSNAFMQV